MFICVNALSESPKRLGSGVSKDQLPASLQAAAIAKAVREALSAISDADSLEALKNVRIQHASDKSKLAGANREIANLNAEMKIEAGKALGAAKAAVKEALDQRLITLSIERDEAVLRDEKLDVTLEKKLGLSGARHPLTAVIDRVVDVFVAMGYEVAEGPEVEAEWFNFDALNIPKNHPARSMQDTFFVDNSDSGVVLRTQTSPVQIRAMLTRNLPIYVVSPGKVFRTDELDATHTPVFHQVEGLVVDKGINMAHLKGTLDHFAATMFGPDVKTRLRPSYFPFTEPSAEVDIYFNDQWIEWGGCGMVNPLVLRACGIDDSIYTGFAFGMGIERTLMFRHGITDMRDMVEGDIRFSQMFGVEL